MKDYLVRFWEFIKTHDFPTLLDSIKGVDWRDAVGSPITWLVVVPLLVVLVLTKRVKTLIFIFTFIAFLVLLQYTLPSGGQQMPLNDLLLFLGGASVLAGINLYFLFVRN